MKKIALPLAMLMILAGCAGPSAEVQHGDLGIMMVMGLELGQ